MNIPAASPFDDPARDSVVERVASIASKHHSGRPVTSDDVAFLLEVIASLPRGIAVSFGPLHCKSNVPR